MVFNSLEFAIFFMFVVVIYFSIPYQSRWVLLLVASYYFYMSWEAEYAVLIFVTTLITFLSGLLMGQTCSPKNRKIYLLASIIINISILATFKYLGFFTDSIKIVLQQFSMSAEIPTYQLLLPVGISFYTFQSLGYSIDVYRGTIKPEKHFGIFALYVSFFPQLVAGPIERSSRLIPQFYEKHNFNYQRASDGCKLILWGLFKKVVIADNIAVIVDNVYNNPSGFQGIYLIIATILFSFQIFCDFSAYSDIAIGVSLVMGYRLMNNFERPYFSKSISEFWRRWHISLSTWLRDYVYVPLGGSRCLKWRNYYNLIIVFLISGLWHGAGWTFVIWGALHGFYIVFSKITANVRQYAIKKSKLVNFPRIHNLMKILVTFSLVSFAWIFFRANSLADAVYIISHMHVGMITLALNIFNPDFWTNIIIGLGFTKSQFLIVCSSILLMETVHYIQAKGSIRDRFGSFPIWVRWATYYTLILLILFYGKVNAQPFIYFQF